MIGLAFYNFSIPSQLKAWVDRIAVKRRTFTYGKNGPIARGNVYGEGSPYAAYEHAETLLRSILAVNL